MNRILLKNQKKSFEKGKFRTKTLAMLLFFMVFSLTKTNAQIVITVQNNTNTTPNLATSYPSLADALNALNAITGMTGTVYMTAFTYGTETAPPKGFTIGSATLNPLLSATNNVVINGNGSLINAGVGTATPSSASPDGMVKLVGTNYIDFRSFLLVDGNTTNPATMEFGVGLFKASAIDGCNNNIIYQNDIKMQRVNFAAGSGPMPAGATGIIMVNSTPTAATTPLTPTSVSGANSFNQMQSNVIDGGNNGIHLYGYAAPTSYTLGDYNNEITNANISNFGGGATTGSTAIGINTSNQWNVSIVDNNIDNNTGTGVSTQYNLYGIYLDLGGNNANTSITGNTLKMQSGSTTGGMYGIFNNTGAGTGIINLNNNTIKLGNANGTTGAISGISNSALSTVLNINNNTVEGISGVSLAGTGEINGIVNTSTIPTVNTNGNNIRNFDRTGASGILSGMKIRSANWNAFGNIIDNLKFSTTSSTGNIYGLNSTSPNTNLDSNIIKNLSIPSTGTIYGIYDAGSTGIKIISSNQIFNFATSVGGSGGSNFYGVYCFNGTVTIANNSIYSLNISGNNATVASSVTGIRLDSPTNTVFNNKIYDLYANSTFGSSRGIFTGPGNTTFYNNVISDLRAPNTTSSNGVNGFITNGSANLYYNTILLNETVKNSGNSGSNAVFFNSTGTLISRNNILINESVASGTGSARALFCVSFATTYDASSNNNLLYAPIIFSDGTNTDTTLSAFKTRMATRDQNSVTETITPFTSTDGSNVDFLRLADGAVSVANNAGLPISTPAITTDYFGVTRDATTPDIGASEFSGTLGTESFAFNSKLSVYPNPSSHVFSINSDSRGSLVVYDLIGKIIKSENINLGITKLDLSNYPRGIYLMKVTNENNETKAMKLIKQ